MGVTEEIRVFDILREKEQDKDQRQIDDGSYFKAQFNSAMDELDSVWVDGVLDALSAQNDPLIVLINKKSRDLESAWTERDVEKFNKSLALWKRFNLQAIEIYKSMFETPDSGYCAVGRTNCDRLEYYSDDNQSLCVDEHGNSTNISTIGKCPLHKNIVPIKKTQLRAL